MKIAVIGTGNMGGALSRAFAKENELILVNRSAEKAAWLADELAAAYSEDKLEAVRQAELVLIAVKPYQTEAVCREISPELAGKLLVSVAAGITTKQLADWTGGVCGVVRAMPNTPAAVGEGVTMFSFGEGVSDSDKAAVLGLFSAAGLAEEIDEAHMDAVAALTGCGPAFVYMFMEAMGDAAVRAGLPRSQSYRLAAQTVRGSASMLLASGKHPGELKDAVCSPGGTTIEGVAALEKAGLRSAVMDAIKACIDKTKLL